MKRKTVEPTLRSRLNDACSSVRRTAAEVRKVYAFLRTPRENLPPLEKGQPRRIRTPRPVRDLTLGQPNPRGVRPAVRPIQPTAPLPPAIPKKPRLNRKKKKP